MKSYRNPAKEIAGGKYERLYEAHLWKFQGAQIRALLGAAVYIHVDLKAPSDAFKFFEAAAAVEEGSKLDRCEAKISLAKCYLKGVGVVADQRKGQALLEEARAIYSPESLFEEGLKLEGQKNSECDRYYALASNLGHAGAKNKIHVLLDQDSQDFSAKADSFVKSHSSPEKLQAASAILTGEAALTGDKDATFNLARTFMLGIGVRKNEKEGIDLFLSAAAAGHIEAQYRMGFYCEEGVGDILPKDHEAAFTFYRLAADAGHVNAQFRLGRCYEKAIGVEKSDEIAHDCYRAAAAAGDEQADKACKRLEKAAKAAAAKGGAASSAGGGASSKATTSRGQPASSVASPSAAPGAARSDVRGGGASTSRGQQPASSAAAPSAAPGAARSDVRGGGASSNKGGGR